MKHKCPICKGETESTVHAEFPFCSERCRERDLGNWATEKYVVSEPVFDLDEGNAAQEEERMNREKKKTIILDLENSDDV